MVFLQYAIHVDPTRGCIWIVFLLLCSDGLQFGHGVCRKVIRLLPQRQEILGREMLVRPFERMVPDGVHIVGRLGMEAHVVSRGVVSKKYMGLSKDVVVVFSNKISV